MNQWLMILFIMPSPCGFWPDFPLFLLQLYRADTTEKYHKHVCYKSSNNIAMHFIVDLKDQCFFTRLTMTCMMLVMPVLVTLIVTQ